MRWSSVILALSLSGCAGLAEAYNQEYVLYDASKAPPAPGTPAADFAKLLEAERLVAEIERVIGEGHDADGALAEKRRALEAAIVTRQKALGDQLGALRAARVAELRKLEVPQPESR